MSVMKSSLWIRPETLFIHIKQPICFCFYQPLFVIPVKVVGKLNIMKQFEAQYAKLKHMPGADGIDAEGRISAVKSAVTFFEGVLPKIMGWRQSASFPEMLKEIEDKLLAFKEARFLLVQDQGQG